MSKTAKRIFSVFLIMTLMLTSITAFADTIDNGQLTVDSETTATEAATPGTTSDPQVTITIAPDENGETVLRIPQGVAITDADLLKNVSAVDQNNNAVTVTVKDIDGLDKLNPQPKTNLFNEPLP